MNSSLRDALRSVTSRKAGSCSALLVWTLAALAPMPVHAANGDWEWSATLYLWLPSVDGTAALPPDDGGPTVDVSTDASLDDLNSLFMGALEVRHGAWGLATDVVHLDFDSSKKGTRDFGIGDVEIPATVNADLKLGLDGWLWSLTGSYALVQREDLSMSVIAGARMLDLDEDLDYALNGDISSLPVPGRTGSARAQQTQWDAIAGLKGRASLGAAGRWYVPYYLDVGAGDSNFTWQALAGLGYSFGTIELLGAWRYLDYDLGDSKPIESIDFNGPAVGVTFRF